MVLTDMLKRAGISLALKQFRGRWNQCRKYCRPTNSITPVLSWQTLSKFQDKISLMNLNVDGSAVTYNQLFSKSSALASDISRALNLSNIEIEQENVAFLCSNESSYATILLACWMSSCTAVPLCKSHPLNQLEYFVKDSSASLLVGTEEYKDQIKQLSSKFQIPYILLSSSCSEKPQTGEIHKLQQVSGNSGALILYTSGTTGPPKGVVLTHSNLRAQVDALTSAWRMSHTDSLLHCLPLHHLHGVLNALLVPLSVGGSVIIAPKFDANEVWRQLTSLTEAGPSRVNVFMGVPTMYVKLLEEFDSKYKGKIITEEFIRTTCKERIRLMVSGSSALPLPIFERWEKVTGHRLLERFGMTEIGMGLTNPLNETRRPGYVGNPMPKVKVRIVKWGVKDKLEVIAVGNEHKTVVTSGMENESGELQIQGPNVFQEYWKKPEATKNTFTEDGWFKTGDVAQYIDGSYKILGRASVDVLKSGGFKISALDVENQLLTHEEVAECAVVGLEDITWGQKVAAVIVLKSNTGNLTPDKLREWAKSKLPHYSVPSVVRIVDQIPRSPIGKINKKELVKQMFPHNA